MRNTSINPFRGMRRKKILIFPTSINGDKDHASEFPMIDHGEYSSHRYQRGLISHANLEVIEESETKLME